MIKTGIYGAHRLEEIQSPMPKACSGYADKHFYCIDQHDGIFRKIPPTSRMKWPEGSVVMAFFDSKQSYFVRPKKLDSELKEANLFFREGVDDRVFIDPVEDLVPSETKSDEGDGKDKTESNSDDEVPQPPDE